MADRPFVLLSCAMSVDGFIDDSSDERLMLSDAADLDRVDELRAGCDAILVGAGTVRRDDPRLVIRSPRRRQDRVLTGRSADPIKVTVTGSGVLDPAAQFFTVGTAEKIVYCARAGLAAGDSALTGLATVVDLGERPDLGWLLADLAERGVRRLLVEGGSMVQAELLAAGLVDELQLAVAPFFVADAVAPRFADGSGSRFPHDVENPMRLVEVRRVGQIVLLRYEL